jgi:serine/threonine-protein kinase
VDQRSDLFSVGIVLHESLTGRSLFRGKDDADTMRRLKYGKVPDVAAIRDDVPVQLADTLDRALERDPKRRYQTATELLEALEGVADACGITPSRTDMRKEIGELCGPTDYPLAPTGHRLGSDSGIHRVDADLAYFLDQAQLGSAPDDDDDDVEISKLLAGLD